MNLKEKMEKFNKRWDLVSTDSYEQAFKKFKMRILNIFEGIDQHVTDESITVFCQFYGIKEVWNSYSFGDHTWSTNIIDRLNNEDNEKEFYKLIELISSLDIKETWGYHRDIVYSKGILLNKISEVVELSDVNVRIHKSDEEIFLYPKGEKMLDSELVNQPLSFLNTGSDDHFKQSLQFYQSRLFIKSAESLRRCLEEYLRSAFKNQKGLSANIDELNKLLKAKKSDPQIRNIIASIFATLDQYFNENSKHNDGEIDEIECEFLIYQVGLLLRYINRLCL